MKLNSIFATILAAAAVSAPLAAQQSSRLQLLPGSTLTIEGTSTLHGFTCKTDKMEAYIDVDPAFRIKQLTEVAHPIVKTRVVIPVTSLKCGEGKMDKNMYETLKADENPTITYVLSTYSLVPGSTTEVAFGANTEGLLTIVGKDKTISMPIKATKAADGTATATGKYALKMTDFGIKPPRFMFGALRVGNDVTVTFNIKASASAVAYLSGETTVAVR
ncbi:MAG: YceI family protein [Gemmatimonadota bacterium]|nr:YceI family protein [Gemmatimonadota bacterium]